MAFIPTALCLFLLLSVLTVQYRRKNLLQL